MADLLRVENLRAGYGEAIVIDGVDMTLGEGRSLALLGRNGVGKTTLLATLVGITRRRAGSITIGGKDITHLRPDQRVAAGLGWVPQERNIFKSLTVDENLTAVARPGRYTPARAYEMFPRLSERKGNLGTQLSGGEQQMLAIGRAMMAKPELLLLDEPSMGLAPLIVEEIFRIILQIRSEGSTVLLVEQNAHAALDISDYSYVIESGKIVLEGSGAEVAHNPAVMAAYLGI